MRQGPTRREFLEAAGATVAFSGLARGDEPGALPYATGGPPPKPGSRPKLAAVTSVYHYLSHAYHIIGRFLDGFVVHDGKGFHRPEFDVASLFIEQTPPGEDLGRAKAEKFG